MIATDTSSSGRHVELILRQIESLPTLPAVATRLLQLTTDEQSQARDVIELVQYDQALTARVLGMCAKANRGVRMDTLTVDKAVILLGFSAVRNAVLSIQLMQVFGSRDAREADSKVSGLDDRESAKPFDRTAYWRHCLAVASAAEMMAAAHPGSGLNTGEAFVCGLLHDIGKLALDHIMPRSYARVVELAELNQGDIAAYERRVIGIDHHSAGKRLAEQWRLPEPIQDCIWLHGSPYEAIPNLEHRRMIGLVSLADSIARRQHIGLSGNAQLSHDDDALIEAIGLNAEVVDGTATRLHERVRERSELLAIDEDPSNDLFLESIQRANQVLGRMNHAMERRSQQAAAQGRVLDSISSFHQSICDASGVQDVLDTIVVAARNVLGDGYYGTLFQGPPTQQIGDQWLICQYGGDVTASRSLWIDPPPHTPMLSELDPTQPMAMHLMGILPWIADYLCDAADLRSVKLLPLRCGNGCSAILMHDRPNLPVSPQIDALCNVWGAAVSAVARQESSRRLGEQLAEANRELASAQDRLMKAESMSRLGEMAAGAAHEMNNPLAVIAGRSQMLSMALSPGSEQQKAAQAIYEQSHRLSDLITGLRLFADPPEPARRMVDFSSLLDETIRGVRSRLSSRELISTVDLQIKNELPPVHIDHEQISDALAALIENAVQAQPRQSVLVTAIVTSTRQLRVQVIDDGMGMDDHTLAHALDPFFSAKAAGRRVGMGLTRANQLIAQHRGTLDLQSRPGEGTTVTVLLPVDPAV